MHCTVCLHIQCYEITATAGHQAYLLIVCTSPITTAPTISQLFTIAIPCIKPRYNLALQIYCIDYLLYKADDRESAFRLSMRADSCGTTKLN
jgi:hypothetical protein